MVNKDVYKYVTCPKLLRFDVTSWIRTSKLSIAGHFINTIRCLFKFNILILTLTNVLVHLIDLR